MAMGLVGLAGCATPQADRTIEVRYESMPAGAALIENGRVVGVMPYTGFYRLSERNIADGSIEVSPLTAQWPSGARAAVPSVFRWTPGMSRATATFVVRRPADAPNLDADMAAERRIQAGDAAGNAAFWLGVSQGLQQPAIVAPYEPPRSVRCTSERTFGTNQVETVCR